jgi:5-aminolevulinate synthase
MESALRHSTAVCPFLKQATPATLRALSTSTTTAVAAARGPHHALAAQSALVAGGGGGVSGGGSSMSRLTALAGRCPVMSQAMAVAGRAPPAAVAGVRRMSSAGPAAAGSPSAAAKARPGMDARARLHTARSKDAKVDDGELGGRSGVPRGVEWEEYLEGR